MMQAERLATDQVETLHLYVVREQDHSPPSPLPLALSLLLLLLVIAGGVLCSYRSPLAQQTVSVPILLLPLQTDIDHHSTSHPNRCTDLSGDQSQRSSHDLQRLDP